MGNAVYGRAAEGEMFSVDSCQLRVGDFFKKLAQKMEEAGVVTM